jgi:hypothetical protein
MRLLQGDNNFDESHLLSFPHLVYSAHITCIDLLEILSVLTISSSIPFPTETLRAPLDYSYIPEL